MICALHVHSTIIIMLMHINASSFHESVYEYTISIYEQICNTNMVMYSKYTICGKYWIIVFVRDIIYIFTYRYSVLKVTPVLLVSYSNDKLNVKSSTNLKTYFSYNIMMNQNNTRNKGEPGYQVFNGTKGERGRNGQPGRDGLNCEPGQPRCPH